MTATTTTFVIDQPGVYDMPEDCYHGDPVPGGSLSSSGARKLLPPKTPAHYDYERRNPPPSREEFDLGKAVHTAVLGTGAETEVCYFRDWKTKAAQQARRDAYAAGKVPLLEHQAAEVEAMAAAIRRHPLAAALLNPATGTAEQSAFWVDDRTGIWRRARFDFLRADEVIDLKTCASADADHVQKAIHNYGYHAQASWYLDAVRALDLCPDPAFVFVFVEKTAPYLIHVVQLDAPALAKGDEMNRRAIDVYAECSRTGRWPGYSSEITTVSLPSYALRTEEF